VGPHKSFVTRQRWPPNQFPQITHRPRSRLVYGPDDAYTQAPPIADCRTLAAFTDRTSMVMRSTRPAEKHWDAAAKQLGANNAPSASSISMAAAARSVSGHGLNPIPKRLSTKSSPRPPRPPQSAAACGTSVSASIPPNLDPLQFGLCRSSRPAGPSSHGRAPCMAADRRLQSARTIVIPSFLSFFPIRVRDGPRAAFALHAFQITVTLAKPRRVIMRPTGGATPRCPSFSQSHAQDAEDGPRWVCIRSACPGGHSPTRAPACSRRPPCQLVAALVTVSSNRSARAEASRTCCSRSIPLHHRMPAISSLAAVPNRPAKLTYIQVQAAGLTQRRPHVSISDGLPRGNDDERRRHRLRKRPRNQLGLDACRRSSSLRWPRGIAPKNFQIRSSLDSRGNSPPQSHSTAPTAAGPYNEGLCIRYGRRRNDKDPLFWSS